MLGAVRPVGFVVLVTLSLFASASWAQQKPAPGTKSESTNQAGACTVVHYAACQSKAEQQCGIGNQACITSAVSSCMARCQ
jgi:hypothetical protein